LPSASSRVKSGAGSPGASRFSVIGPPFHDHVDLVSREDTKLT
jgi:hypothetical protein